MTRLLSGKIVKILIILINIDDFVITKLVSV